MGVRIPPCPPGQYEMSYFCHKSNGIFGYEDNWWLLLQCDKGIVDFYVWLANRYGIPILKGSKYGPHISVVKGELPRNIEFWNSLNGQSAEILYTNQVRVEQGYAFLDVRSEELAEVRRKLGFDTIKMSYHLSLGRYKYGSLV